MDMFGSVDLILIRFCKIASLNSQDVLLYIAVIICPSSNSVRSGAFLRHYMNPGNKYVEFEQHKVDEVLYHL
jgi:hypothetical protein